MATRGHRLQPGDLVLRPTLAVDPRSRIPVPQLHPAPIDEHRRQVVLRIDPLRPPAVVRELAHHRGPFRHQFGADLLGDPGQRPTAAEVFAPEIGHRRGDLERLRPRRRLHQSALQLRAERPLIETQARTLGEKIASASDAVGGGFGVFDRPVQGGDGAFFAGHPAGRGAGGAVGGRGLVLGGVGRRLGGEFGRDASADRVGAAFDVGESHPLRRGNRMRVGAVQGGQDLAGHRAEFDFGEFGEGHGDFGGFGGRIPHRNRAAILKIRPGP